MERSIAALELEVMLLARHLTLTVRQDERALDRSAYTILTCLACGGPMSLGQLSETIGLETSTLNRQTTAMRTAGMLERIPDPQGGIARKFRLTREGEARLMEACRSNIALLERVTTDWSRGDLEAFAAYLERFNRGIEEVDHRAWPRPAGNGVPGMNELPASPQPVAQ
jgi:DNA-binding MarR family transcriptional regulator